MNDTHGTMTRAELGSALERSLAEAAELRRARDAVAHAERRVEELNAVLIAVRNVNQLISREKDPYRLLKGACHHLAGTRGYLAVWAMAEDPGEGPSVAAQAGLPVDDRTLLATYRKGLPGDCPARRPLSGGELHVTRDETGCDRCAICRGEPPHTLMVAPLAHESRIHGELCVMLPLDRAAGEDERQLLMEVASDLGFALHAARLEVATREATAQIVESERRYRTLFDTISSGVAVYRPVSRGEDFAFVDFNKAGERIERVRREDIVGKRVTEVFPGVREFGLLDVLRRVSRTGRPEHHPIAEYRDNRIQGWRNNYVYRLPSGEVVAVYDDVTREKQAEQRLREAMVLYKTLVGTSPDATVMTDLEGVMTFVSPQAVHLFRYECAAAMTGKSAAGLVDPSDRAAGASAFDQVVRQGILRDFPLRCVRADGVRFHGEISASTVRRDDGSPRAVIAVVRDVTERRETEEAIRTLNHELEKRVRRRTAELMEANKGLEAFAYSVSHDLRAPLRTINFFSHVVLEDFGDQLPGEAVEYIQRITDATRRMDQLIRALLDFSRVARAMPEKKEVVDLSALAHDIVDQLRKGEPDRQVRVVIEPELAALGHEELLRQALHNLFSNAWKFTARAPAPEIHFGSSTVEGQDVFFVRDNGAGFDMARADRLFQPFQRLHDADSFEGTGIGLATVKRIVTRHGGRVWAEAETGKGATFLFTLNDST